MKKLLLFILSISLFIGNTFSQQILPNLEEETVFTLNEELRKLRENVEDNTSDISSGYYTDRGDPTAVDFDVNDFTTDETWNDLDLSGIVDSGTTAVLLKVIVKDGAVESTMLFRKNGNSNEHNAGGIQTQVVDVAMTSDIIVPCDSDGVIEYNGSNLTFSAIDVVVKGWWN